MAKARKTNRTTAGSGGPIQWLTLGVCFAVLVAVLVRPRGGERRDEGIDDRIALAAKLVNRGLPAEAVAEYRAAFDLARGDASRKARLCYLIGRTYLQSLKDHEQALGYLIRAEHYGLEGAEQSQAEQWIVQCLERTGRSLDAQNRVRRATSMKPQDEETTGPVIATIGDRKITMADLDAEIRALPTYMQKQFSEPAKKAEFLDEYLARQLLVQAAERADLDHDPEVLRDLDRMRGETLVRAYFQREIEGAVQVSADETKLYYEAHKDEFLGPREFTLSHIETTDEAAATSIAEELKAGRGFAELARERSANEETAKKGGLIGVWSERSPLPAPLDKAPALRASIAQLQLGQWTDPTKMPDGSWQLVRADSVTTPTPRPFAEVQSLVKTRLHQEKTARRQQEVLDRLRKAEKVVVFRDVFEGAKSSK